MSGISVFNQFEWQAHAMVQTLSPKAVARWAQLICRPIMDRRKADGRVTPSVRPRQACLLVLKTGKPWEYLPREPGGGSGMTCTMRWARKACRCRPSLRATLGREPREVMRLAVRGARYFSV